MIYVLDTSCFKVLKNYYPSRFPSLWSGIGKLADSGRLISVREVLNELESYNETDFLQTWAQDHKQIFLTPGNDEQLFVREIFKIPHSQALISQKSILRGTPVADPFVIAAAKVRAGCVVTQESKKPNAAKIPNICEHFGIECVSLEGFMEKEGWEF